MELKDENTCKERECAQKCDQVVAEIQNENGEVHLIDIEDFFRQLVGTKADSKEKCDFLMYDDREKVVLCELTCSKKKYIDSYSNGKGSHPGKREKAKDQMRSVLHKLCEVPEIESKLLSYSKKVAVFAYRLPDLKPNSQDRATVSMSHFIQTPMAKHLRGEEIGAGFVFEQIQYPTQIQW